MTNGHVETAINPEWRVLTDTSRPHGKAVLLTSQGIAVIGDCPADRRGYVAWFPLPRLAPEIKELLYK